MPARSLQAAIDQGVLSKQDRQWFPRWLDRYRGFLRLASEHPLPVDTGRVIAFLRRLRDQGKPAWQRLQAAQAIEFYRNAILRLGEPDLAFSRLFRNSPRRSELPLRENPASLIPTSRR